MKTEVIVRRLHISRKSERHYFHINLPVYTKGIRGIELGGFVKEKFYYRQGSRFPPAWLGIKRPPVLGQLQLQSAHPSNFFYSTELTQTDYNIGTDDYLLRNKRGEIVTLRSSQHTHGNKNEADTIQADVGEWVYGCYKDLLGVDLDRDIQYVVQVYITIEVKE